jgi:hypothetical protein
MPLNNKTINSLSHQRAKFKYYAKRKQRKSLPPEKKVKILETDADAHKKKQESLSPEDKDLFVKINTAAQHKHHKSLSPDQKAQINTKNAAEQKKHQESLLSGKVKLSQLMRLVTEPEKVGINPFLPRGAIMGRFGCSHSYLPQ